MPKENVFHQRRILFAKLNDLKAEIPIIVAATAEELSQAENHFTMTDEERDLSRLQLFIKKGKMFAFDDKKATTKITGLASKTINIFGKPQQMAPVSIMQNVELSSLLKEKTNLYLEKVLKVPSKENANETYLQRIVEQLYQIIKASCPNKNEVIHLATIERELSAPDAAKNRLTAEFSKLILAELKCKIAENHELWKVELDRVISAKQRTSRAESYGIHRIAQQPLLLFQSRKIDEEITAKEKVIIVDDHIQAGAAIVSAATEILNSNADLLSIICISAHKNTQFFNIQNDVKEFISSLLPNGQQDVSKLEKILKIVELSIETLTNFEGMILCSILLDPKNPTHKLEFERLLEKYDASDNINHSLFKNQKNSLISELEKPKVEFKNFESELLKAIEKGRYTIPYTKQIILSDEDGQAIRNEIDSRAILPWLLFDFDDTLHYLNDNTFIIFQNIIKAYSKVEIPIEIIKQKRQNLKSSGQYQYQQMLLDFIREHNNQTEISCDDITKEYQKQKEAEPFIPKISKNEFLALREKYRIGIITDNSTFANKVSKFKDFYGVDIDGYVNRDEELRGKPHADLFQKFCKTYDVKTKPIAYIGDSEELDGAMAKKANLKFIKVDPSCPTINIEELTKELSTIEENKNIAKKHWELFKNVAFKKHEIKCQNSSLLI